jgi:hypothetical protein
MAGNGGYQAPRNPAPASGPGKLARRTDGGPGQKVMTPTGLPYGDAGALEAQQKSAALSQSPSVPTAPVGGDAGSGGGAPLTGSARNGWGADGRRPGAGSASRRHGSCFVVRPPGRPAQSTLRLRCDGVNCGSNDGSSAKGPLSPACQAQYSSLFASEQMSHLSPFSSTAHSSGVRPLKQIWQMRPNP